MSETPILVASELTREFGSVTVIEDVSLELEAGSLTALVGPNGSGKTTLVRLLAGILSPSEGEVSYEGPDAARQIGYLPQRPSFRPGFTADETLAFYSALVETDPAGLLDRVGLGDAADRRVEALSGGMTRLLGLAQATIGDPPVVLLDEPASGLDPGMREQTFEVARQFADEGKAVLCCSHDLALVDQYCDRVLVLDGGSLVAADEPDALLSEHDEPTLQDVFTTVVDRSKAELDVIGVTE